MNENISFEDLVEAFLERCRIGDAPDVHAYAQTYPEHAAQLQALLPLMLEMEGLGVEKTQKIQNALPSFPNLAGSDYRLLRKIGSGGMGSVFEALQISLNRKVAVKLLLPSLVKDAEQREQFEHEARIIAALHHPNIIKVLSAGCNDNVCYYAMELVDGKGLDQCHFATPREIAEIGLQVAKALAYAHRCKVMHRDIKPANLLLDAEGVVHVGDFGLAYILQGNADFLQENHGQSGTIRYMPPERLAHKICSFASDQYSFGATLYELISGAPLLAEGTPQDLIRRICAGPIPPLQCAEPDLAAIVNKSIRFQEADRYPDMDALAEDLRRFLHHEPVVAASPSLWKRFRLWAKRKPAVAALSLAGVLLFLAFVVALSVGYIRTHEARTLAERNAANANATLSDIFAHIERQTPSAGGSDLLARLMPYYQEIAQQRKLPQTQIASANMMVGTAAMRSGNYEIAESAFRRAVALLPEASVWHQLAEVLNRQGKTEQAEQIFRKVSEQYPDSDEAVYAFQSQGEHLKAFELVQKLLQCEPKNPEYRFQYALLLGTHPQLFSVARIAGVEPNAVTLLNELAEEYPDRPEYGLALVDLMCRKMQYSSRFQERDWKELDLALALSDRLLGRFPNTPGMVSSVVELRQSYITMLRRKGDVSGGRKETERLQGMLEILFYGSETPDTVKELLLLMQLERLARLSDRKESSAFEMLFSKIRRELKEYHGEKSKEFQDALNQRSSE